MEKRPNPQGKGLSPVVGYLQEATRQLNLLPLHEDSTERVFEDYLSSLLVLSCSFSFRPVIGREYYMYYHGDQLVLSLVSPDEGGEKIYDEYWTTCILRNDYTWLLKQSNMDAMRRLTPDSQDRSVEEGRLKDLLESIQQGKIGRYDHTLGYYQNILNYALGKSVGMRSSRLLALQSEEEGGSRMSLAQNSVMEQE